MADNSIALFVFEGEKQERQYLHIFLKALSDNVNRIEIAFCTHIYALHDKLKEGDGLDTFELLKEECKALNSGLEDLTRDDIGRIYLFFDYDGHVPEPGAGDEKIQTMLKVFDNETEEGKLFLSYPMLETLGDKRADFKNTTTKIQAGSSYKSTTRSTGELVKLPAGEFKELVRKHLKKANNLVNRKYQMPDNLIEQSDIFTQQLKQHITPHGEVAVLSALPLFYLDYKGTSNLNLLTN